MRRQTPADNGLERFHKQTRRETFVCLKYRFVPYTLLCGSCSIDVVWSRSMGVGS